MGNDGSRAIRQAFRQLGWRRRLEVVRHAKRGEVHPDETTEAIALRWARWMQRHRVRYLGGPALMFAVIVLVTGLLGNDPLDWLLPAAGVLVGMWWWSGPAADRIVRAAEAKGVAP